MTEAKAPCLNCPDRYPACHDHCDRYGEWKEIHERIREAAREQDQGDIVNYERDRHRKLKKKTTKG